MNRSRDFFRKVLRIGWVLMTILIIRYPCFGGTSAAASPSNLLMARERIMEYYDANGTTIHPYELRVLDLVLFKPEQYELTVGEEIASSVEAFFPDGKAVNLNDCEISYGMYDERIIEVNSAGIIKALSEGSTSVTVTVTFGNSQKSATQSIIVKDPSEMLSLRLQAPKTVYLGGKGALQPIAHLSEGGIAYIPSYDVRYKIVSAEPDDVITLSSRGVIQGNKTGTAVIEATVVFRGETYRPDPVTVSVEASDKKALTIWTEEERANARENIEKYSWAAEASKGYIDEAERYVKVIDTLYEMVVAEGLPRYYFVGEALDPERFYCRYCKTNIAAKYGLYSWIVDPINDPWKIKCPECRRRFPSNDFGSFYELGKDENGIFNIELAHKRNDELIAKGEPGYLVNVLYPEKGEGWGVDDGFGYFPGNVYDNGVVERHNYIAYYLHEGLWHGGVIDGALRAFMYAYIYTGDPKYGRAGAILLDRVADFYPGFDWHRWRTFRGDGYKGKILDVVWENALAQDLARAYDAFFPMFEDPEVISFLSEKAKKYNLENPKDCTAAIRKNIEDGILREIFAASKDGRIAGNFGMTQLSVATAAVALDTMPETGEWLDWIMKPDENETSPRPAGNVNILQKLVDVVDRNGMGNEASPSYNSLWLNELLGVAELLYGYQTYPGVDLYKNPKFVQMFTAQLPIIMADYYTMQIGDSGGTASTGFNLSKETALIGFKRLGDPRLAQYVFMLNGNTVNGLNGEITEKDPEKIRDQILEVVHQYGPFHLDSDMMTGYGFAAVRDGANYRSIGNNQGTNSHSDFSVYFGIGTGHGHNDALNLGIDAFGLNMAPDLGYPEDTGTQPNRIQWVSKPLSHNTVMVDGKPQVGLETAGTPHHFDDSGRVKIIDVDANKAYPQTKEYRRTVVMVEADDENEVFYGVDFFRIVGGNDHIYSFHSQSDEIFETEGLNLVPQTDEKGNYIGTYASPDVPWGKDPNTIDTLWSVDILKYPPGFTWLDHVRRDSVPEAEFSVDFKVKDFRRVLGVQEDLHLRMTMLNDFTLDEVAIAQGKPPQVNTKYIPYLEYVLARRTGENLNTLFTTVFEPYKKTRYIDTGMTSVPVKVISGTPSADDAVKAVRIPLKNGRVDYVVYATNNKVLYRVDDLFDFRGFVGVYSVLDGQPVYMYVNDGDVIDDNKGLIGACTGTVKDFTRELALENTITVTPEQKIDPAVLENRYIYVENDGVQNGAYRIERAEESPKGDIILHIGQVSPVRSYKDPKDFDKGYIYNIETGQRFRIPLPNITDSYPVFEPIKNQIVNSKSEIRLTVSAKSAKNKELEYKAVELPKGASFDPSTGEFSWTPQPYQLGQHKVSISAFDGEFARTVHFMITVIGSKK
jgi:hypothetical protein